jgi:hypothetical protein
VERDGGGVRGIVVGQRHVGRADHLIVELVDERDVVEREAVFDVLAELDRDPLRLVLVVEL